MLLAIRPLPALARAVPRRCFSAAVDAVAPEVREKIAEIILRERQRGMRVQWTSLRKQFNVSLEVARQIEVQAAAAAKRSSPVSARITRLADDAYDAARGQRDWSAVARKAGLPLVECLGHFSAELSKHPAQPRPTLDDWSTEDILAVRELLHGLPKALYYDAWNLAGAYITADPSDCRDVFGQPHRRSPAPKVVAALKQHRDNGMTYGQLHERFPIYSSRPPLVVLLHRMTKREAARGDRTWDDTLSPADRERIKGAVREHYRPGNRKAVIQRLVRELPHIDPYRIDVATASLVDVERRAVKSKIDRLGKLVSTFGDDWDRIGRELDTTPSFAKAAWIRQTAEKATGAKDAAATSNSDKDSGVSPDSSRKHPRKWTDKEYSELLQLVADYGDEPVDWAAVGEVLGRGMDSCLSKYHQSQRSPPTDPQQGNANAVNAEVQKQLACGSGVDWEQVGRAVGLDVRRCQELCRVDEGKGRWDYDPDTFSWALAKRMEAFIADNYPAPAAPNFRAVSNYLWIELDDCIRVFDALRGKIMWTDELKARVAEMRESRMTYAEIGRQLTPHPVSLQSIRNQVYGEKRLGPATSAELRKRVVDFLDSNAEGCTYYELFKLAKVHFAGPEECEALKCLRGKAKYHRTYAARLDKVDTAAVFEQVASGTATRKAMAAQLGVPPATLGWRIDRHESKMYSGTWTDVEMAQLMELIGKSPPPYSWVRFAKRLGTKSVRQCISKYYNLRTAGQAAPMKK